MTFFNEVWTEARVSRLTALWAAGMSCSQIAASLGCFAHCDDGGRSAVIGKIHRLKLPEPAGKASRRTHKPYVRQQRQEPLPRGENKPLNRSFDAAPPPATSEGRIRNVTRLQAKANGHDPGLPKQRRNPSHNILAAIAIGETEPCLPERLKGEPPDGTGIPFLDLTSATCHWPRGDPLEADFEFCGGKALPSLPYCAHHCRIAFTPATERRRYLPRN
jgi:GcrA cell cycle regulator